MTYTCACCGWSDTQPTEQDFMDLGWDTPTNILPTTCPICPSMAFRMDEKHSKAHALWAKEGRPGEFSFEKCSLDDDWGDPEIAAEFKEFSKMMDRVLRRTSN